MFHLANGQCTLDILKKTIIPGGKSDKIVQDYLGGKEKSFGALVGGVMKETKGRANPRLVNELLKKILARMR